MSINLENQKIIIDRERHRKYRADHREEWNERRRKRREEHREEYKVRHRRYYNRDITISGKKKGNIRSKSYQYLSSKHCNLPGYEIHHCFGYEDFKKFIYIPKYLHLQIHKMLVDLNIRSDSDHWMAIRDLVNSCDEYTYISV